MYKASQETIVESEWTLNIFKKSGIVVSSSFAIVSPLTHNIIGFVFEWILFCGVRTLQAPIFCFMKVLLPPSPRRIGWMGP